MTSPTPELPKESTEKVLIPNPPLPSQDAHGFGDDGHGGYG